jgi:hypothetical protein
MKARNQPGSLLYVSPKRYETYTITDPDVHIAALRRDALSLMRFLDAKDHIAGMGPDARYTLAEAHYHLGQLIGRAPTIEHSPKEAA